MIDCRSVQVCFCFCIMSKGGFKLDGERGVDSWREAKTGGGY
jgi:hypothetical protein